MSQSHNVRGLAKSHTKVVVWIKLQEKLDTTFPIMQVGSIFMRPSSLVNAHVFQTSDLKLMHEILKYCGLQT